MTALNLTHFDVFEYVRKSKELGANEELVAFQARQIEKVLESNNQVIEAQNKIIQEQQSKLSLLEAKEPATKKDLEITKLELQKEIEVVRKDIEMVKGELKKEIEIVRKEIEVLRGETQKEIEIVRKEIVSSKNSIIIWLGGMILGSGLLQHFFR